ncbi:MAG: hypothetical protein NWF04_10665 [Candidatus Bathyarchaeota archaeon]|nr:hypothetical protein [Candidatus Bathyarchaeota archaeon]
MKYYVEEVMAPYRLALEEEVLSWDRIGFKKMFGCPCYKADERLFVFLVTEGIVITRLEQADREKVAAHFETTYFRAGEKQVKSWIQISLHSLEDLNAVMPYVKESYLQARKQK